MTRDGGQPTLLLLLVVEGAALALRGQQVQLITGVDVCFVACADLTRDQSGVEVRVGEGNGDRPRFRVPSIRGLSPFNPPRSTQLLHSTWSAPIYLSDDIDNQRGDLRGAQKEKK